jgi:4a-hydroxytetrahydrobiopterin dehydratase
MRSPRKGDLILPSATLTDQEIEKTLAELPGWTRSAMAKVNTIQRVFEFPDFVRAMQFVKKVAEAAESANHHPDIDIRYNKVTIALTSHDSGGVTNRDVKMAKKINEFG